LKPPTSNKHFGWWFQIASIFLPGMMIRLFDFWDATQGESAMHVELHGKWLGVAASSCRMVFMVDFGMNEHMVI